MKGILLAIARAFAAAGRLSWVTVWEGGRLVSRLVRTALTPPDPVGEAEAAFEAEAQRAPEAPAPLSAEEAWGRAALAHLMGEELEGEAVLDDAATAYLDGLSVDQQVALSRHDNATVGRHLLGERLLPGLPRPMTPAEYRGMEAARTAAAAAQAHQRLVGDDAKRRHFIEVLDDLIAEPRAA